jgi:hypothetical protein
MCHRPCTLLITLRKFAVNHSCEPNVAFNLSSPDRANWHIRALKRIEVGDPRKGHTPHQFLAYTHFI